MACGSAWSMAADNMGITTHSKPYDRESLLNGGFERNGKENEATSGGSTAAISVDRHRAG